MYNALYVVEKKLREKIKTKNDRDNTILYAVPANDNLVREK